jgi:hypothetical protein
MQQYQAAERNPVMASPSPSQVIGVWKSSDGATLTLVADGTFQARDLPEGIGDWANGVTPSSGRGQWRVGRFDASTPVGRPRMPSHSPRTFRWSFIQSAVVG